MRTIKNQNNQINIISLLFLLSSLYGQTTLLREYHLNEADVYELPNISPANDILIILASKEREGTYLMKWYLDDLNHYPERLFEIAVKKKKKKKGKKTSKTIKEESIIGWLSYNKIQYLYSVTNHIRYDQIISKVFSHPFGDPKQKVFQEFHTLSPNTPISSKILNNENGILISFLNGPYGYYHYSFDMDGLIESRPSYFSLRGPVQSMSQWNNNEILVLEGQENIYHMWISTKTNNWDPRLLDIDLSDYTILGEANCHPTNNDIFSFSASSAKMMQINQADICIYSLSKGKITKKITTYAPSEPYPGTEYSQWSKKYNRLYFLRQNDKEHIQLFYYDMDADKINKTGIPDNRIKSFEISERGDRLVTIGYPDGGHVKVYRLDE